MSSNSFGVRISLLVLAIAAHEVQGQRRISQTKCDEYRSVIRQTTIAIPLTLNPAPLEIEFFNCSRTVDLIIGGEEAQEREFPHQALIGWAPRTDHPNPEADYDFRCDGSLISDRYVLTAAHCSSLDGQPPEVVRLAELDLRDQFDSAVDFEIASITRHPSYVISRSYHDIALVLLKDIVRLSGVIRPACLWDSKVLNFTSVIATGFGHRQFAAKQMSNTLRKVRLDALDRKACADWYDIQRKFPDGVKDHQLCFGSRVGGKDTCQGDSGGPIQVTPNEGHCTYYVVGVTSYGSACGLGNSPAIYTSVASHLGWIESIVWGF